jgi:branched-chain amino acid transport system ATP-binding protein
MLLLDEPLAGLGSEESARMVALLGPLKHEQTTLLIEHDMDAVCRLAGRITVLVDGRVIAAGLPDEIRADAAVRAAYLGAGYRVRRKFQGSRTWTAQFPVRSPLRADRC